MTTYDPPLDPNVGCERCGEPLVVLRTSDRKPTGMLSDWDPMYGHVWVHKHGSPDCRIVDGAKPSTHDAPAESIREAIRARQDAEDDEAELAARGTACNKP